MRVFVCVKACSSCILMAVLICIYSSLCREHGYCARTRAACSRASHPIQGRTYWITHRQL